tara:strand:- start:15719 stop:18316 length:2598 start_codon:yes stop_codon:yes gene_type:complete
MKDIIFISTTLFFSLTLFSQVSSNQNNMNSAVLLFSDDFEGNGNIPNWVADASTINTEYSNPYPKGINTSNTVLKYEDTGGHYANFRCQATANFDLSVHSSFTLKIYVPSSSITGSQTNQISLKLQDGTLNQPWITQSEIIKPIVLDQWQEVSFDFATDSYRNLDKNSPAPITRTDFNRVLLQVNSENNNDHITAYIDDFLYNTAPIPCDNDLNSNTFTNSNLPIVIIDTNGGATIPDEPKILGTMKIIQRPNGERNFVCDADNEAFLDYSGTIGIEIRGSSSQTLDKKPYGIDTLEDDGLEDKSVKLLGMAKEDDWVLNSFAFDDSMMRDYISYEMARQMGQYAAHLKYCEVVLNGKYIGLYALSEKIKRDGSRVNIAKLGDDENSFPEVTGGYLMQTDRTSDEDAAAWYNNGAVYIHEKPNSDDVTIPQSTYIESVFRNLDNTAVNANITNGYPSVIDVTSFIDYMLVAEISSNADAYALSTYYHKDKGGKLRAGPIWDYNLTYGNDIFEWNFDRSKTDVWQFDYGNTGAGFWKDLFGEPTFQCYLSRRFDKATKTGEPLSYNYISSLIDATTAIISEAVVRENEKWNTIDDFSGEVTNIKSWLAQRIIWMKNNLSEFSNCNSVEVPSLVITKIDYNPLETDIFPESDDLEFIEIKNTGSTLVDLTGIYLRELGVSYQFAENTSIVAGQSIILAGNPDVYFARYGSTAFDRFHRDLSNKNQRLVLADAFGNVIDEVNYSDKAPWPETADGDGFYLELIDVNSDNAVASNWKASASDLLSSDRFDNSEIEFTVYPNPAQEQLWIKSKQRIQEITIFNTLGQQIKTLQVNFKTGKININEFSSGVYFLNLKLINGARVSTKIFKK